MAISSITAIAPKRRSSTTSTTIPSFCSTTTTTTSRWNKRRRRIKNISLILFGLWITNSMIMFLDLISDGAIFGAMIEMKQSHWGYKKYDDDDDDQSDRYLESRSVHFMPIHGRLSTRRRPPPRHSRRHDQHYGRHHSTNRFNKSSSWECDNHYQQQRETVETTTNATGHVVAGTSPSSSVIHNITNATNNNITSDHIRVNQTDPLSSVLECTEKDDGLQGDDERDDDASRQIQLEEENPYNAEIQQQHHQGRQDRSNRWNGNSKKNNNHHNKPRNKKNRKRRRRRKRKNNNNTTNQQQLDDDDIDGKDILDDDAIKRKYASSLLKLPTPIIVMGFPKAGTSSIFDFFRRQTNLYQHFRCQHWYCCRDQRTAQNGGPRLMADCMIRNLVHNRSIFQDCGDFDLYGEINGPRSVVGDQRMRRHPNLTGTGLLLDDGTVDITSYVRGTPTNKSSIQRIFFPQYFNIQQIHEHYPNATFILNTRPFDSWIQSVQEWGDDLDWQFINEFYQRGKVIHTLPNDRKNRTEMSNLMELIYNQHHENVRRFVQEHPSHTLIEVPILHPNASTILGNAFGLDPSMWTQRNSRESRTAKLLAEAEAARLSVSNFLAYGEDTALTFLEVILNSLADTIDEYPFLSIFCISFILLVAPIHMILTIFHWIRNHQQQDLQQQQQQEQQQRRSRRRPPRRT